MSEHDRRIHSRSESGREESMYGFSFVRRNDGKPQGVRRVSGYIKYSQLTSSVRGYKSFWKEQKMITVL